MSASRHRPARHFPRTAALLLAATLATGGLAPVRPLQAQTQDDLAKAEAKALEAQAFFKSKLFAQAASRFMEAYALSRKATLMFNAARAYEENGQAAEAVALFEQYLKLPDASEDGRRDAKKRIADLRVRLGQPAPPPERPPPPVAAPPVDAPPPPSPTPPPTGLPTPPAPTAQPVAEQDGQRDALVDVSGPLWFAAGCAFGMGLLAAYVSDATPPPARLVGKTPEFAIAYTGAYRKAGTAERRKWALYGCGTFGVLFVIGAIAR